MSEGVEESKGDIEIYYDKSVIEQLINQILDEDPDMKDDDILRKIFNTKTPEKHDIPILDSKINLCFPRLNSNGNYFYDIKNSKVLSPSELSRNIYNIYKEDPAQRVSQAFLTNAELTLYRDYRHNKSRQDEYILLKQKIETRAKIILKYDTLCVIGNSNYDMFINYIMMLMNEWAKRGYFYKITPNTRKKNRNIVSHKENKEKYKNKKFEHLKLIFETAGKIDFYLYLYNIAYNGVTHIHFFTTDVTDKALLNLHHLGITYKHKGMHYINMMNVNPLERPTFIRASSLSENYNINTILDYCEEFLLLCKTGIDLTKYKSTSSPNRSPSPYSKSPLQIRHENGFIGVPDSKYTLTPGIPNCAHVIYSGIQRDMRYDKWDPTNLEFTE